LQITQLTALKSLHTECSAYSAESMAVLTALTSLTRLKHYNRRVPACLSALTWLEELDVGYDDGQIEEEVDVILPSLLNLTCLSLEWSYFDHLPSGFAGLPRLQRLCILGGEPAYAAEFDIPQGPWLASIRCLSLPLQTMELAVGFLQHAPCLQYLCVDLPFSCLPNSCADAESLAIPVGHPLHKIDATHPPLRCSTSAVPGHEFTVFTRKGALAGAVAALQACQPPLRLRYLHSISELETHSAA